MKTIILPSQRVRMFEKICDILYDFGERYEEAEYEDMDQVEEGAAVGDLVDGTALEILGVIEKCELSS